MSDDEQQSKRQDSNQESKRALSSFSSNSKETIKSLKKAVLSECFKDFNQLKDDSEEAMVTLFELSAEFHLFQKQQEETKKLTDQFERRISALEGDTAVNKIPESELQRKARLFDELKPLLIQVTDENIGSTTLHLLLLKLRRFVEKLDK